VAAVLLAVTAYSLAAGGAPDFALAVSPASQSLDASQAATYGVTLSPSSGFAAPVALSVGSLPPGTTVKWRLSNGTSASSASVVAPTGVVSATFELQTSASTPPGSYYPLVTATSGPLSHASQVTLVVQPASASGFVVSASPANLTMPQGETAAYALRIERTNFTGSVRLSLDHLPNGVSASLSPTDTTGSSSTVDITTASNARAGSYTLILAGEGTVGGKPALRFAALTLTVQKNQAFGITGDVPGSLSPGASGALDLQLTNPYGFPILVSKLNVAVEEGTTKEGCSGVANFAVTQVPASGYPITLPANTSRTLSQLGIAASTMPQLRMLDTDSDQAACMGARIALDYTGAAAK
jgi:hypothetical protein